MFSRISIILVFMFSLNSFASWDAAQKNYKDRNKLSLIIKELVDGGYYFAALPMVKEYLGRKSGKLSNSMDRTLAKIINKVGVKQFETLPFRYLEKSRSQVVRYILAKKYMRKKRYSSALKELNRITTTHSVYPFASNMKAVIYSLAKENDQSISEFRKCEQSSLRALQRDKNNRRLQLNRDYCVLGVARTKFASREHIDADLLYLDIPKSSMIWPEILFEEAWNSYYKKDYNRTLGKLVSYKAPVFAHMFNPEIDVLSALSYLKLCLYPDAKKISNDFYKKYLKDARSLRTYLKRYRKNLGYYHDLITQYKKNKRAPNELMKTLLSSISKEEVFRDLKKELVGVSREFEKARNQSNTRFKRFVLQNIQESISSQKKIIGGHVRGKLLSHYVKLYKAFEGMSYIKLEVLAQRKAKLYSFDETARERGDIKFIQRNDKQYFWDFNGEFWADELGDYVFALRSEC